MYVVRITDHMTADLSEFERMEYDRAVEKASEYARRFQHVYLVIDWKRCVHFTAEIQRQLF